MKFSEAMSKLRRLGRPSVVQGMKRFGLPTTNSLGVTAPRLHALARQIGTNQKLSLKLWSTRIHDARVLAALIGDATQVTKRQMVRWANEFDSWGVCDACCGVLFVRTPHAVEMALRWSGSRKEFVKRAGFALMAEIAIHQKHLGDREFRPMLQAI